MVQQAIKNLFLIYYICYKIYRNIFVVIKKIIGFQNITLTCQCTILLLIEWNVSIICF
jgi:hypothetical protein